ncbi:general transcription factor 3C polypeptide 5 [Gouania willdenowi]|uniref:General transcription factor IIIC, polypeptide 5 n=1 Tax=Gouania willdenowi TaxID=441366 RepID=A0A8C5EBU3_GOUWI|nr:general transcription factor 3C polypeptide 5 [Gouania willdenowi]
MEDHYLRGQRPNFQLEELTLSAGSESLRARGSSCTVEIKESRLMCVEYPAVVNNVDKMLNTLGGEETISKLFAHPNRRLELRFRPQDPFCHSLCGNRFSSSNILIKVKRRVRKKDRSDVEIQTEVLGVIGTTYRFQGMADFQYLAVHSQGGENVPLYDKIILRKPENQGFFEQPVPHFLIPAIFSRLDSPVDYFYRPDIRQNLSTGTMKKIISVGRRRRTHFAIFVNFSDASVPSECLEEARTSWNKLCQTDHEKQAEHAARQLFESRPIWSKNGIKANVNLPPDKIKRLLPAFAYYMVTGPWRSLWVRFGYDPRKTPDAKKYQLLDFRIRCSTKHGYSHSDIPVKAKRSAFNYKLPITFNKAVPQAASVMDLPGQEGSSIAQEHSPVTNLLKESSYIFREGMLPPHRQMFYQLCDLHVESIQALIEQNTGTEQHCDERDGWCVPGTTHKLRNMISAMIMKVVRANQPALPEHPGRRRRRAIGKFVDSSEEEEEEDVKEDDEDLDFQPSEGSENEMETEMLDYM